MTNAAARVHRSKLAFATAGSVLLAIALVAAATFAICQGHFLYTLDDPYISLALSSHISHGHYGLNASEPSSPSSSILYPFVLAAFARLPFFDWIPLLINSLAAAATAALFATMFARYSLVRTGRDVLSNAFLIVAACIGGGIVGVVFTGLEHSLHVLLSVAVVYGLACTLEEDVIPLWLLPVIVLEPLMRFEGLALSGAAILVLAAIGRWRAAGTAFALTAAAVGTHVLGMKLLGLPAVPSSVLVKATVSSPVEAASRALAYQPANVLWVLLGFVLAHPILRILRLVRSGGMTFRREAVFAGAVLATVIAHVMFGAWGWWFRYEVYLLGITMTGAMILWHAQIRVLTPAGSSVLSLLIGSLFLYLSPYVDALIHSPEASLAIYEQQYQVRRFVVDFYRQPVAANDVGLISYANPNYVLDLWGLGSEEARKARMVTHQAGWMRTLTESHSIPLAIVYPAWFGVDIPPSWQWIASLHNVHHAPVSGIDDVEFYATSAAAVPKAMTALRNFRATLDGTTVVVF